MATFDVAFEKGATSQGSPFSYVSNAGTVPGTPSANANRGLFAAFTVWDNVVTPTGVAVTWNGVSMTSVGSASLGNVQCFYFYLIAPASGAQTISASWTGGTLNAVVLGAIAAFNTDQGTGYADFTSATANSTAESVTIPNMGASDLAVAGGADDNSSSATIANGTEDWQDRNFNGNHEGGHRAAAGTIGWTLGTAVNWVLAGVRIKDVAVARAFLMGRH